jgi:hypothetical protein
MRIADVGGNDVRDRFLLVGKIGVGVVVAHRTLPHRCVRVRTRRFEKLGHHSSIDDGRTGDLK